MIEYIMMDKNNILPTCLHDRPIPMHDIRLPAYVELEHGLPTGTVHSILETICALYEACGVLAIHDNMIIGKIRFYPEYLFDELGNLCVQTKDTIKKLESYNSSKLIAFEDLSPKSLFIHCYQIDSAYRGQGIAGSMLRTMLRWAKEKGWESVYAYAIPNVKPLLYWTGDWSVDSYLKMGFEVIEHQQSKELMEGVANMRAGRHGDETKKQWEEYDFMSDTEASQLYTVFLKL